jgi:hypothetical protein
MFFVLFLAGSLHVHKIKNISNINLFYTLREKRGLSMTCAEKNVWIYDSGLGEEFVAYITRDFIIRGFRFLLLV